MTAIDTTLDRADALAAKIDALADQVALLTQDALERQAQREAIAELLGDVAPIAHQAMEVATERLAEAEAKGYFTFARSGLGVIDQVVTGFTEDDVEQLGANIVTILELVKEITQPEILAVVGRLIDAVQHQQLPPAELEEAPSLFALIRQLREPEVRLGLARALATLRTVSAETAHHTDDPAPIPTTPAPQETIR
jgi:uncharacterized protein YjgD (DUF1641 family)